MGVLVMSCFLAAFTGQLQNGGKREAYMRKMFEAVSETNRQRKAIKENEWEGEWRVL